MTTRGWRVVRCSWGWLEVQGPRLGLRRALREWRHAWVADIAVPSLAFILIFTALRCLDDLPKMFVLTLGAIAVLWAGEVIIRALHRPRERVVLAGSDVPNLRLDEVEADPELIALIREMASQPVAPDQLPRSVRSSLVRRLNRVAESHRVIEG